MPLPEITESREHLLEHEEVKVAVADDVVVKDIGWGEDEEIDIDDSPASTQVEDVGPLSKIECPKGHKLRIMEGKV